MAATLPYRPPVTDESDGRRSSRSSYPDSQSASTFSHSPTDHTVSPQTSVVPRSPATTSRRSSQPVSLADNDVTAPRGTRLKSQYPVDSSEPHVEYILVASFDIDRGPIMEHQYPGAISPEGNMLAELMLPDQTHLRTQDWTMFFLHKEASPEGDEADEKVGRRQNARRNRKRLEEGALSEDDVQEDQSSGDEAESEEEDEEGSEGPPLMYVLNLVNTKQDNSVKRGAVVKAMAICTRHSFLHIYKPLLLLALEDYYKSPVPETLSSLYNAVNAMDLSLMPRLSSRERHILQASDAKDMFVEKFERMIRQRKADEAAAERHIDSRSKTAQRYVTPRDTHEFETKVIYNEIPIPIKVPVAIPPETVGDFSLIKLIQTFDGPHASQPQPFALHPHLTTSGAFTHPVLVLINAMLTQKRVIFLGHNRPSGEVAEAVLSACALASGGVLRGFTRHAFPYTDLTKIDDLLKVPGFVAGVTNPAFANHPEWWDILCDLPSGRMKISSRIEAATVTEGLKYFQQQNSTLSNAAHSHSASSDPTGDTLFMEDVIRTIANRYGESSVRAKFRAYILKFTRIAAAFEESVYGASALYVVSTIDEKTAESPTSPRSKTPQNGAQDSTASIKGHGYVWPSEEAKNRELAACASRIEGWRNTRSYYSFISDLASHHSYTQRSPTSPTRSNLPPQQHLALDLHHALSRLRCLRLSPAEAGAIYLGISSYCVDYASILELLELTPVSEAGLFYVNLGLWHEERKVREAVALLLQRVKAHEAGRHFIQCIGGWAQMGWLRCLREKEARFGVKSEGDVEMAPPNRRMSIEGHGS